MNLLKYAVALKLDIWEIIEAAKTKPFGYTPFYPGPGLGGHCIPVDPLYLTWKLKDQNINTRFINLADEVNSNMPKHVVNRAMYILNDHKKALKGSKVLVLGAAYKKNIDDYRESPAIDIIGLLTPNGANVSFSDDLTGDICVAGTKFKSQPLSEALISEHDLIIIITDHDYYNYEMIANSSIPILDSRNVLRDYKKYNKNIYSI